MPVWSTISTGPELIRVAWAGVNRPDALQRDIEASLRRLRIEAFDLMQIHEHDLETPLEDTFDCLVKLQTQGKIRAIGVSNFSLDALAAAFRLLAGNLYSTQNMFNLLEQGQSAPVRQFAEQNQLRFLGYSPFAQGVLAGKLLNSIDPVNDWRNGTPAFHPANAARVNDVITRIALPIAQQYDITLPQLILAATLSRPGVNHVIAGAGTTDQVRSNAGVLAAQIPDAALESLVQALSRCGWSRLAGQPLRVRLRALARKIRRIAHL